MISPLVISAIGMAKSGKETAIKFLAEELWDDGYKNLVGLDNVFDPDFTRKLNFNSLAKDVKTFPIILIARLRNEEDYKAVKDYSRLLLLHVKRNPYKEGAAHQREKQDVIELAPEWLIRAPSVPVRNDDGLRRFRMEIKDAYTAFIKTHKNWKHENENKKEKR